MANAAISSGAAIIHTNYLNCISCNWGNAHFNNYKCLSRTARNMLICKSALQSSHLFIHTMPHRQTSRNYSNPSIGPDQRRQELQAGMQRISSINSAKQRGGGNTWAGLSRVKLEDQVQSAKGELAKVAHKPD